MSFVPKTKWRAVVTTQVQNRLLTLTMIRKHARFLAGVIMVYMMLYFQNTMFDDLDLNDTSKSSIKHTQQQHPFPSIGIFVAADAHATELYEKNLKSIQCYGKRHGYDVILVSDLNSTSIETMHQHRIDLTVPPTPSSRPSCSTLHSFSFQRQCVATRILPHYDFLVVLDADVGVVNANVTIENILLRAARDTSINPLTSSHTAMSRIPHVVLEERFHTGEIMAATFVLQNTTFAQAFLNRWIGFYDTLPAPQLLAPNKYVNKFYHHKRDNPSLNMAFVQTLAEIANTKSDSRTMTLAQDATTTYQPILDNCHRLWKQSIGSRKYLNYLRCIHNATVTIVQDKQQPNDSTEKDTLFPLYLFRRGHGGLGRDISTCNGLVSPLDVFVHNVKEQSDLVQHTSGFYKEMPTCLDSNKIIEWQAPVADDRWRSMQEMTAWMKTPACLSKATQIGDCWPECSLIDSSS